MKPYFVVSMVVLIISVLGAIFFSVVIPSLIPEYRKVDENFNCGASEIYLHEDEMFSLESPFGSVKNE